MKIIISEHVKFNIHIIINDCRYICDSELTTIDDEGDRDEMEDLAVRRPTWMHIGIYSKIRDYWGNYIF